MSDTRIDWADKVWNPVTGCTKVSPGCRNCYAERMAKRLAGRVGYPADRPFAVTVHDWWRLEEPLHWKKPSRIFVCSMGDLFHEDVPNETISSVFGIMAACPQHTFLVLTKRPKRMRAWFEWLDGEVIGDNDQFFLCIAAASDAIPEDPPRRFQEECIGPLSGPWPLPNVWVGVTAEDQERADERIPILLQTPAVRRFVSCEPLLGPIDLDGPRIGMVCLAAEGPEIAALTGSPVPNVDWVIAGGETGPSARPAGPDWFRLLRDRCKSARVPFFLKQRGEWVSFREWLDGEGRGRGRLDAVPGMVRVGRTSAGHLLDGVEHREVLR